MKTYLYIFLKIISIVLTSIVAQAQTINEIRYQVPLKRTYTQGDNCSGSTDNIRITIDQFNSLPKSRTQYYNSGTPFTGCSLKSITIESSDVNIWEGQSIVNNQAPDDPMTFFLGVYTHFKPYIDVRPTLPGTYVYRLNLVSTINYTASDCHPAAIDRYIFTGEITIIIEGSPPKPTLVAQTQRSPFNNQEESLLLSVPPLSGYNVEWSPSDGQSAGNTLWINNPFNCNEYKARYYKAFSFNSCPRGEYSNIIVPSKAFKPSLNSGYSQAYSSFLQSKVDEAENSPEYHFRWQFNCIQKKSRDEYNRTGENGWGGGFAKYLFNNMSIDTPCEASVEEHCAENRSSLRCTMAIGIIHFYDQLRPNFSKYLPQNPTINHGNWDTQHNAFLTNAVEACFDELFSTPNTNRLCFGITLNNEPLCLPNQVSGLLSKKSAVNSAIAFREVAQFFQITRKIYSQLWDLSNSYRNQINTNTPFPPPIDKQNLFSPEIENMSILKVTKDTTFYLHVNQTIQLKVTYTDSFGNILDLTHNTTGTKYELDVDSTVATITSDGLLHIKSTSLPFINGRLPLAIFAYNGNRIGIGQFAIMDTDSDNDLIVDSYERKLGLSPYVANLGDLDGDYLLDVYEAMLGSNPLIKDSDADGFSDVIELQKNTNLTNIYSFPQYIQSITSGAWNSTNTWSCNCIPSRFDSVVINEGHKIQIPSYLSVDCNTIVIKQGAIFEAPNSTIFNVFNR